MPSLDTLFNWVTDFLTAGLVATAVGGAMALVAVGLSALAV